MSIHFSGISVNLWRKYALEGIEQVLMAMSVEARVKRYESYEYIKNQGNHTDTDEESKEFDP